MAADQFWVSYRGKTAAEAFEDAVDEHLHEYGHSGYTGTIAEKSRFVEFEVPEGVKPEDLAHWAFDYDILYLYEPNPHGSTELRERRQRDLQRIEELGLRALVDRLHDVVEDKWGPAACVKTASSEDGTNTYLFFGWASS